MEYFPLAIAFTGLAVGLTAAPIIRWANDISQEPDAASAPLFAVGVVKHMEKRNAVPAAE